ncbi:MAG: hypothetical protein A3G25_01475 [Betaproteobacteria bacterium RIFCSPLOWO2_12_FULL_63_13]|nr:MAG: hypothetical protein A3G25_01475 [Betaproteobacteria bacterium RIFCSPLOWO2_12_FULL_63_13]
MTLVIRFLKIWLLSVENFFCKSPRINDLAPRITLKMEQRVTHHPPLSLGPWKLGRIYTRSRIDVTCALKCDIYFHLGALRLWGYVAVLQLFVYLISEGFSRPEPISVF